MGEFQLDQWAREGGSLAVRVPADEVFGLLTREIQLPSGVAALARREEGDYVLVRQGRRISAQGITEVLWVKTGDWRIALEDRELVSQEGYRVCGRAEISLRPILRESELKALQGRLLNSRNTLAAADLTGYLERHIRTALRAYAAGQSAETLVNGTDAARLTELGRENLKQPIFEVGLEIDQPLRADFECEAVERLRRAGQDAQLEKDLQQLRSQVDDALHAQRLGRLERLREVFDQVRRLTQTAPGLRVENVLAQVEQGRRGEIYQASLELLAEVEPIERIVVSGGTSIAWIDPQDPQRLVGQLNLGPALGGVRSIEQGWLLGRNYLLVGAATGVHLIDAETRKPVRQLQFKSDRTPRGGFNSVKICRDKVLATHSELGIVVWTDTQSPGRNILADRTADAQAVRCATSDPAEHLIVAVDRDVLVLDVDDEPQVVDECTCCDNLVTALTVHEGELYAGDRTGQIVRWAYGKDRRPEVLQVAGGDPVRSLQITQLGGVDRLVVGADLPWVSVRVLRDAFSSQYQAPQPVRWALVVGNLLIAVDASRHWFYTWPVDRPQQSPTRLNVAREIGHRMQDFTAF